MKKAIFLVCILFLSVFSTACINNFAVQELNNKAMEYMKKGDYENAIGRLKSSLDLDSSVFETQYNLAIAYTNSEDYENAISTFKSAIELNPNFADAYYSLAVAQENYAKAINAGTSKKQTEKDKDSDDNKNNKEDNSLVEAYKPSSEELTEIQDLYKGAIDSYNEYLNKNKDAKDRAEVITKIDQINEEIKLISDAKDGIPTQGENNQ